MYLRTLFTFNFFLFFNSSINRTVRGNFIIRLEGIQKHFNLYYPYVKLTLLIAPGT